MKKAIYFLPLIILMSCSGSKSNSESTSIYDEAETNKINAADTLQNIINANINKQPRVDTIALGFSFEMTKEQFIAHYNDLKKQKKLILSEKNIYKYPMSFDRENALATLVPEFRDKKLYKLSLDIQPADDTGTTEGAFLQAVIAYLKKYESYTMFETPDAFDAKEKEYHWIKNNLHIDLQKGPLGAIVSYINMPVEQEINNKKAAKEDSLKAVTNKNI